MARLKFEWAHADTCLPDYWGGHHLPHVQIPVYRGMKFKDIKQAIWSELQYGFVSGSTKEADMLNHDFVYPEDEKYADQVTKAAYAAVNRMKPAIKGTRTFFKDLEPSDDEGDYDSESIYAYFVLVDIS